MIRQTQHSLKNFTVFNKVPQAICFDPPCGSSSGLYRNISIYNIQVIHVCLMESHLINVQGTYSDWRYVKITEIRICAQGYHKI
jgi:hypothetical protein